MTGLSGHRAGNFVLKHTCVVFTPTRLWAHDTSAEANEETMLRLDFSRWRLHGVNSLCVDVGCGLEIPSESSGGAYGGDNALALGRAPDLRPTAITGMPVRTHV